MKKLSSLLVIITILISVSILNAAESNIDLKGGIAYPDAPNKVGFDSAVSFNLGLDKYFALGLETGFQWVKWEESNGTTQLGNLVLTQNLNSNVYSVPLLLNARVRFAQLKEDYGMAPYLAAGAGYSWTFADLNGNSETFHGFTWQTMIGTSIQFADDSNIELIVEAGYRGTDITSTISGTEYTLDMSGFVAHIGVRFPFGGEDDNSGF